MLKISNFTNKLIHSNQKITSIKLSRSDRIFSTMNIIFLLIILVIVGYPMLYVLSASFTDVKVINSGEFILFPKHFTLKGYEGVFNTKKIWIGYANSAFYTIVGTALNVFVTMITGFALSRKNFLFKKTIFIFFLITMFFNGGLIPTYLVVRNLGLINTRWALILPSIFSLFNVFITMRFIEQSIPEALYDAARIDGCGDIRFFISVVLPLSKAIIAVNAVYYGVGHWNQYFNAFIYLNDENLYPLQIFLRQILVLGDTDTLFKTGITPEEIIEMKERATLLKFSLIVISSLPVILIYPFVQKYFVKGILIGSVK